MVGDENKSLCCCVCPGQTEILGSMPGSMDYHHLQLGSTIMCVEAVLICLCRFRGVAYIHDLYNKL